MLIGLAPVRVWKPGDDGFQARSWPEWFEPVVHQHMPVFHMERCVPAAL